MRSVTRVGGLLPPKISRVGAAADSVVVVSVVSAVSAVVVVMVVEEAVGAGTGAATGGSAAGSSADVGGVTAPPPASLGLMAKRSSSGAMVPLPSVVAKGSSGEAAGEDEEGRGVS